MNINEVLEEIQKASMEIPFENSQFQTDTFVIQGQIVPTRAYRAILLRMNNRIQALNEAKYSLAKKEIDMEECEFKISKEKEKEVQNNFDIRRWELEISENKEKLGYIQKLVHDAITELNHLYSLFKRFPKYTREQFELGEREYFEKSLNRQVSGLSGAPSSLLDMNSDSIKVDERLLMSSDLNKIVNDSFPILNDKIENPFLIENKD